MKGAMQMKGWVSRILFLVLVFNLGIIVGAKVQYQKFEPEWDHVDTSDYRKSKPEWQRADTVSYRNNSFEYLDNMELTNQFLDKLEAKITNRHHYIAIGTAWRVKKSLVFQDMGRPFIYIQSEPNLHLEYFLDDLNKPILEKLQRGKLSRKEKDDFIDSAAEAAAKDFCDYYARLNLPCGKEKR